MTVLDAESQTQVFDRVYLKLSAFTVNLHLSWKDRVHVFFGNGLSGTATLNLAANKLTGRIPDDILKLEYLRDLHLSRNSFRGRIPDVVSSFPNLESLDLSANELKGHVPGILARMSNLQKLFLGGNRLFGEIPKENGFGSHWKAETFLHGNEGLCGLPLSNQCRQISWTKAYMSTTALCVGLFIGFGGVLVMIGMRSSLRKSIFPPRARARSAVHLSA